MNQDRWVRLFSDSQIHEGLPSQLVAVPTDKYKARQQLAWTSVSGDRFRLYLLLIRPLGKLHSQVLRPPTPLTLKIRRMDGGDNILHNPVNY